MKTIDRVKNLLLSSQHILNCELLEHTFTTPLIIDNGNYGRVPGQHTIVSVKRNSPTARMRLFTDTGTPIEIPHCHPENLYKAVLHYHNQAIANARSLKEEEVKKILIPYEGKTLKSMLDSIGVCRLFENQDFDVWNHWLDGDSEVSYNRLERIVKKFEHIKELVAKFKDVDPESLPLVERSLAYRVLHHLGADGALSLSQAWEAAIDLDADYPVIECLFPNNLYSFNKALEDHNITTFAIQGESSGLMRSIHFYLSKGWVIDRPYTLVGRYENPVKILIFTRA